MTMSDRPSTIRTTPFFSFAYGTSARLSDLSEGTRRVREAKGTSRFAEVLGNAQDRFVSDPTDGEQLQRLIKTPREITS